MICCRQFSLCVCSRWLKHIDANCSISVGRRAFSLVYYNHRIFFARPRKLSDFAAMLSNRSMYIHTYRSHSHTCIRNTNDGNEPQAFNEESDETAYPIMYVCVYVPLCTLHTFISHIKVEVTWIFFVRVVAVLCWLQLSDILVHRFLNIECVAHVPNLHATWSIAPKCYKHNPNNSVVVEPRAIHMCTRAHICTHDMKQCTYSKCVKMKGREEKKGWKEFCAILIYKTMIMSLCTLIWNEFHVSFSSVDAAPFSPPSSDFENSLLFCWRKFLCFLGERNAYVNI